MSALGCGQWDGEFLSGVDGVIELYGDRGHATGHAREADEIAVVVRADEWDALNDLDAAIERAAEAYRINRGCTPDDDAWTELHPDDQRFWRETVRPIVLAALGRES